MLLGISLQLVLLTVCGVFAAGQPVNSTTLPVVDLGYGIYQASSFDATGGNYNFSNIRYAQPPVGNLRFRAPLPPKGRDSTINDGRVGRICPQANPAWELISQTFLTAYLTGQPFNGSDPSSGSSNSSTSMLPAQDPRSTEDCLFLDVVVPQTIFKKASNAASNTSGAPVLVWIYGGGYTAGEKSEYNPSGLIRASQVSGSEGVIFVSLNYRLGVFGWLAGPTLQSDGVANAGLYDQRLALEWVRKNIHLFGGDPNRVTVIGESAGGGSIMHQITAFGGEKGPVPFQQAVLQSPGFQNVVSYYQQEQTFDTFLALVKASSLAEVRKLPYAALQTANILQVGASPYGFFSYGPVVDGLFAPAIPGKLLLQGSFHRNVKLMLGHNADEGLFFTSPFVKNDTAFDAYVKAVFPTIEPAAASYLENVLYPPTLPGVLGTTGYSDETGRIALADGEASFTCNTYYLERAFNFQTYGYQFSVPPALHGQDIAYTFFNGPGTKVPGNPLPVSDPIAVALQEYITSFAVSGVPTGPSLPVFPLYGNNSKILDLNVTSITQITDPVANSRCLWWQKELYA